MKHQKTKLKRTPANTESRKTILIVCEGKRTEPNYFVSFSKYLKGAITVEGFGANTYSLVKKAIDRRKELKKEGVEFEVSWVVFDKDSFPLENFNRAFEMAGKNNFRVAHSNEAFELWYLLHYDYIDAGLSRDQYKKMLTERLGFKYEKNLMSMYSTLLDKQDTALRNAKKLMEHHKVTNPNGLNPERDNPSTTVHELVEELNKYRKE